MKKKGTFSSFRWFTPDIYHIDILRNLSEGQMSIGGRSAKPKDVFLYQK